jgi:hypothetical protein
VSVSTELPLVIVGVLNDALTPGGNADVERETAPKLYDFACTLIVAAPPDMENTALPLADMLATCTVKSGYVGDGTAQFLDA